MFQLITVIPHFRFRILLSAFCILPSTKSTASFTWKFQLQYVQHLTVTIKCTIMLQQGNCSLNCTYCHDHAWWFTFTTRGWTKGTGSTFVSWIRSTFVVSLTTHGTDSDTLWPTNFSCLYSSNMLLIGARPTQARRMLSMHARWRNNALTSGVPRGTSGALHRKLRIDNTEWKLYKSQTHPYIHTRL